MDFRDTSFYDVPGMLAQQTLSGNLDVRNTLLNRESLSPSQRRSLYEAGTSGGLGNRFADTLGEIFTNPFTYLALLTGPVGAKALRMGKPLMSVANSKHPLMNKTLGFLESMGVMDPVSMLGPEVGAHVTDAATKVQETMANIAGLDVRSKKPLLSFLSQRFGRKIETLNPDDFSDPEERSFMKTLMASLGAKAHGLDKVQIHRYQEYVPDKAYAFDKEGRPVLDGSGNHAISIPKGDLNTEAFRAQMREREEAIKANYKAESEELNKKYRAWKRGEITYEEVEAAKNKLATIPYELRMGGGLTQTPLRGSPADAPMRNPLMNERVDEFLAGVEGWQEYLAGKKLIMDYSLVRKIGKEEAMLVKDADGLLVLKEGFNSSSFEFDDDKVARFLDYQRNRSIKTNASRKGEPKDVGENLVNVIADDVSSLKADFHERDILHPGGIREIKTKDVDKYKEMFREELRTNEENGGWASRNTFDVEDADAGWENGFLPDAEEWSDRSQLVRETRRRIEERKKRLPEQEREASRRGLEDIDERGTLSVSSLMPRTNLVPRYSTRDLEVLHDAGLLTREGVNEILEVRQEAMNANRIRGENTRANTNRDVRTRTISLDLERSTSRSARETGSIHSYITGGSDVEWNSPFVRTSTSGDVKTRRTKSRPERPSVGMQKGDSNWRGLTLLANASPSEVRKNMIRDIVVPVMTGTHQDDRIAALSSMYRQKSWAGFVANGMIGKAIEDYGGKHGKEYVRGLRLFADSETMPTYSGSLSDKAASYLYVTHMGFNLASVTLNMLQPLTNAATITDPAGLMKSYGRAIKSMFGYAADRAKLGMRFINHTERNELIKKHFPWADDIGLTADFMKVIDADHLGREGGFMNRLSRIAMSGFEKSEWFNRVVTANILEEAYKKAGRIPGRDRNWASDLRNFNAKTQFASDNPLFRPAMFNRGAAEGFDPPVKLTNPLIRMFMQFPLRTATTFFVDAPGWGGQDNYWKGLAHHSMRALGYSAIVYETARGLFGADLSRGLVASSATDVIGGNKMLYEDQWFPTPPVLRLPVSMIRGVMGDKTEFVQAMSALIPGGMALSRAMAMAPETPLTGILQKTYADYSNIQPDGTVPIYKADGTLIGYQKPSEIVLKGFGLDLGSGQTQGKIDGYLIKQRQEIIKHRHEFLRKLAGNDISGAESVRAQFSAKYKDPETGAPLPLTVTQSQVKQYLRSRDNIGRTERILDSLSPDVRMQMANYAGPLTTGVDLSSGTTAMQRQRYNPTSRDERVQEIWGNVQSVGAAATADTGPVGPAATFTQGQ